MLYREEKTASIVNQIFEKILLINPGFRQAWPSDNEYQGAKKEWVIAFKQAGLTDLKLIKKGLDKVRLDPSPFPPSPGKFIEMCKLSHDDINAPEVDEAYLEACKNAYPDGTEKKWSHPVVKYAYEKTGPFSLRVDARAKTYPLFKKYYEDAIQQYSEGRVMNQLENKKTPAEYQEYVGRLKADIQMGMKPRDTAILSFEYWQCTS